MQFEFESVACLSNNSKCCWILVSLSSQPLSKCGFGLQVNEEILRNFSIAQISFLGNRLGCNFVRAFSNQLHLFAAKSKGPAERRQIQKLQAFRHFYGSTLEDATSKLIVHQEDVSGSANASVKKTQKKHVSIFTLPFPNLFSLIQERISSMSITVEILCSQCTGSSQLKRFKLLLYFKFNLIS